MSMDPLYVDEDGREWRETVIFIDGQQKRAQQAWRATRRFYPLH